MWRSKEVLQGTQEPPPEHADACKLWCMFQAFLACGARYARAEGCSTNRAFYTLLQQKMVQAQLPIKHGLPSLLLQYYSGACPWEFAQMPPEVQACAC